MKYDEKSGQKIPENRSDEVKLSLEKLAEMHKETKGMLDRDIVTTALLQDINISLGLIADMLGMLLNKIAGVTDDKKPMKQ